jgi:hypothetical protein
MHMKRAMHESQDAEMFILDHFGRAREVAEAVNESGIFRRVELIESLAFLATRPKSGLMRRAWRMAAYARSRRIVAQYFELQTVRYDDAYFTYADVLIQLALTELRRRNPLLRVHLFEDGAGGYHWRTLRLGPLKRRAYRATGYDKRIGLYDDMWVFRPDLFSSDTDLTVHKIPAVDPRDNVFLDEVNQVFYSAEVPGIQQRVVFLEQPVESAELYEEIQRVVASLIDEDWIVKLHPRSRSSSYGSYPNYPRSDVPWESICQNVDIGDKTIVSYFSTAALTPNIIFELEPRVVFLFALRELKAIWNPPEDLEEMVKKFRAGYVDATRVLVPESMEELRSALSGG